MDIALFIVILLAGFYLAWNIGANDVANAMGTSVGSGALTLRQAVVIAAILEFCGAFFFGSHVSKTMQSGIVNIDLFVHDPLILVYGMLASLLSAGVWLQVASYFGWPVSTTHSIVGAIIGFGLAAGGVGAIFWGNVSFIASSWILSPILGGALSYYLFNLIRKKIFYTLDPVKATRQWVPVLTFFVMFFLLIIVIFEGGQNINLNLSFFEKFFWTFTISLIGALISYFAVRNLSSSVKPCTDPLYHPNVLHSLEKAQKHLNQVKLQTKGEVNYTASLLVDEVDLLTRQVEYQHNTSQIHSEYEKVEKAFGFLQIMTACMMAFAHGANDVANAIGPLSAAIAILTTGVISPSSAIPTWALALGGAGIVVGLATWGWRVIDTIGKKITELTPSRGFAAEFGAATTIVLASRLGLPISTTHTLVGSVLGVGFARGIGALNLSLMRDIVISWIVTVPLGALCSMLIFYPLKALFI